MGVVEEGGKAVGGVIEAMRGQPLVLAMGLMNLALLLFLFYYMSRITSRTETTAAALFSAQDNLFSQWSAVVKDSHDLVEKSQHCILPDDAIKLMTTGILNYGVSPLAPVAPTRPSEVKP
jgi:hypothetical protein